MAVRRKRPELSHPNEIFLAHANQDRGFTIQLAEDLRRHGVSTWYSERNIGGARRWLAEIGEALERCDWMIVILTPAALKSDWVYDEVAFALGERRYRNRVIPFVVKKCEPKKLIWALANVQAINARPYENGLRKLLAIWRIGYRKS